MYIVIEEDRDWNDVRRLEICEGKSHYLINLISGYIFVFENKDELLKQYPELSPLPSGFSHYVLEEHVANNGEIDRKEIIELTFAEVLKDA